MSMSGILPSGLSAVFSSLFQTQQQQITAYQKAAASKTAPHSSVTKSFRDGDTLTNKSQVMTNDKATRA